MSDALTLPPESPPVAREGDRAKVMAARRLAILGRVAEVGMEIIEALGEQAGGGAVVVQGDLALAYDRVARAVRHTLMLQEKLEQDFAAHRDERSGRQASLKGSAARLVRDVIDDEIRGDADRKERLSGEAAERLRGEDFGDLLIRPFGEAVAGICRDLGLTPDWLKLAEDCCKVEAALAPKSGKVEPPPIDKGPIEIVWMPRQSDPTRADSS